MVLRRPAHGRRPQQWSLDPGHWRWSGIGSGQRIPISPAQFR